MVAKFSAADVKGSGARRYVAWIWSEKELGTGVDEAADEPGASDPVDVDSWSGRPLHPDVPVVVRARRFSTA